MALTLHPHQYNITLHALVFMSPETAVSDPWRTIFRSDKVVLIAIDEAHCITEWLAFSESYISVIFYVIGG